MSGYEIPSWVEEFGRTARLKSMIFLTGNILDKVPVQCLAHDGSPVWNLMHLHHFLQRHLNEAGYRAIGFFDPSEGLTINDAVDSESGKSTEKNRKKALELVVLETGSAKRSIAIIVNFASRFIKIPGSLDHDENEMFTLLLKASLEARSVFEGETERRNLIIFLCDKLNDLPAFMYVNNPCSHSIHIQKPGIRERREFILRNFNLFHARQPGVPSASVAENFSAYSSGMTYSDLLALGTLSKQGPDKIPLEDINNLCRLFKYGNKKSEWEAIGRDRLLNARQEIRKTVKGQDEALNRVFDIIKRARIGLAAGTEGVSNRPRGVLFFAGPTGVGKTEMAKALAKMLFGDSDRCIRFDMSEYGSEHSDQKLLGAPPGYIGFDEGGQLTRAVKENPFSVLLFDEIDKAHKNIFDKFLQILDDGRLTDGRGETVYFSECVIIFTSNYGISVDTLVNNESGCIGMESYEQMKMNVQKAIEHLFNHKLGRPEILNRFGDNFVVFDYLRPPLDREIVEMLVGQLKDSTQKQRNIRLSVAESVTGSLVALSQDRLGKHGGRGIRNVVDEALVNPLCRELFDRDVQNGQSVRVDRIIVFPGTGSEEATKGIRYGIELFIGE